jgi:hypothetical protein
MKKLFFSAMCIALVGVGLTGCKKEQKLNSTNEVSINSQFNVSSNGKMLVFGSVESYEKSIELQSAEKREKFLSDISKLNFKNYFSVEHSESKSGNDSVQEMDDFFGQLLNEDGIIQIGDYIYKVNLHSEKVFVLPVSNLAEYQDLVNENKSNDNIRQFTTNDDVIYLAESGASGEKCNNPSSGFELYTWFELGNSLETRCIIKYFTAGIYYRVTGRSKKIGNYGGSYRYILECVNKETEIRRNPCNNDDVTRHLIAVKSNTLNDPEPVWEMYSKAWRIKNYTHIQIRTRAEFYDGNVTLFKQTPAVIFNLN